MQKSQALRGAALLQLSFYTHHARMLWDGEPGDKMVWVTGGARFKAAIRRFVIREKECASLFVIARRLTVINARPPPVNRLLMWSSFRPCTNHFHSTGQSSLGSHDPVLGLEPGGLPCSLGIVSIVRVYRLVTDLELYTKLREMAKGLLLSPLSRRSARRPQRGKACDH